MWCKVALSLVFQNSNRIAIYVLFEVNTKGWQATTTNPVTNIGNVSAT